MPSSAAAPAFSRRPRQGTTFRPGTRRRPPNASARRDSAAPSNPPGKTRQERIRTRPSRWARRFVRFAQTSVAYMGAVRPPLERVWSRAAGVSMRLVHGRCCSFGVVLVAVSWVAGCAGNTTDQGSVGPSSSSGAGPGGSSGSPPASSSSSSSSSGSSSSSSSSSGGTAIGDDASASSSGGDASNDDGSVVAAPEGGALGFDGSFPTTTDGGPLPSYTGQIPQYPDVGPTV